MTSLSLNRTAVAARLSRMADRMRAPLALRMARMGAKPARLLRSYEPLDLGDGSISDQLLAGRAMFSGMEAKINPDYIWGAMAPSAHWARDLHSFEWLAECALVSGEPTQAFCQKATAQWLVRFRGWRSVVWRPDVAARRLRAWLSHPHLPAAEGAPQHTRWRTSLTVHADFLERSRTRAPQGIARLETAAGLIAAGLCLAGAPGRVRRGVAFMLAEAGAQISPGGSHTGRNPADLLRALELLVECRKNLALADHPRADAFDGIITRLSPALRLIRHGDGGLAVFNGASALADGRVDRVLAEARVRARAPDQVGGYARLSAGRTAVILDVGRAPEGAYRESAHAGTLALEMSHGRRRIVVNCGSAERLRPDWRAATRATAAHSTMVVDDASSSAFLTRGFAARALGPWLTRTPSSPIIERTEDVEGSWILISHDGYESAFGLVHERRLFLSPDGYDLRGEDTLTAKRGGARRVYDRAAGGGELPYAVRFHLHPDVKAEVSGAETVSLTLPSGDIWQMRQSGGRLEIEESVYLAEIDNAHPEPRATKQIVVSGFVAEYAARVVWLIRRADPLKAAVRDVVERDVAAGFGAD